MMVYGSPYTACLQTKRIRNSVWLTYMFSEVKQMCAQLGKLDWHIKGAYCHSVSSKLFSNALFSFSYKILAISSSCLRIEKYGRLTLSSLIQLYVFQLFLHLLIVVCSCFLFSEVILTLGNSRTVMEFLCAAKEKKRSFRVFVAEGAPRLEKWLTFDH